MRPLPIWDNALRTSVPEECPKLSHGHKEGVASGKGGKARIRKMHPLPEALVLKYFSSFPLTFCWLHLSKGKLGNVVQLDGHFLATF